jgi:hypothetical protein
MAMTSIFYFLNKIGYYYFELDTTRVWQDNRTELVLIAQCQRYYCLFHASFVTGLLAFSTYKQAFLWRIKAGSEALLLLKISGATMGMSFITGVVPGLSQFQHQLANLSFVASVLCLVVALQEKNGLILLASTTFFVMNMAVAFLSGWKEEILVPVILLGVLLFPMYKRVIILTLPVAILLFFVYVPAYNTIVRKLSWSGEMDAKAASNVAIEAIRSGKVNIAATNWEFLIGRLSEIGMFTNYVRRVPGDINFYGFTILRQTLENIVPRALWPGKPITEAVVMQRVYEIGVVDVYSKVSAKPPAVTDAYLSGGVLGILMTGLFLGFLAARVSVVAETLFGGYIYGSALVYTGLFQVFWRGNCFEFMFSTIFWSYILMLLLFRAARYSGVLVANTAQVLSQ